MQGRIIKGIAGFYYVHAEDGNTYECKAKGIFRKDSLKPLVGDEVVFDVLDAAECTGNIVEFMPRQNALVRPNVANIDQALIIFAVTHPEPNFITLDKMILQYSRQDIPVLICFNKEDIADDDAVAKIVADYEGCGHKLMVVSAKEGSGLEELKASLTGKLTAVAGPSGVGKSSIINSLQANVAMETGEISEKLERGKHTTRHSEIIPISDNTYIMDTPGFGSFDLMDFDAQELADYYEEFKELGSCHYCPCTHIHEPDCRIKEGLADGRISQLRYSNYVHIFNELNNRRPY